VRAHAATLPRTAWNISYYDTFISREAGQDRVLDWPKNSPAFSVFLEERALSVAIVQSGRSSANGARLMAIGAAVAFVICLVDYFTPHGAIAHQWGTMLVLVSTLLMLGASCWIAFGAMPRWLLILFEVLIILDILGTALCAYFLESHALLVFMAIALVGWIWHLASDSPRISAS
jgi:hypothetical protein